MNDPTSPWASANSTTTITPPKARASITKRGIWPVSRLSAVAIA